MQVVQSPRQMNDAIREERRKDKSIGFVPTLGFLHEGHEALMREARRENDILVVSRFVNPTQFRKKAFDVYPRDAARDNEICARNGVDYVFAPETEDMYPYGFDTAVEVRNLTGRLEGAKIRWHYRGVTTVVAKLFNIVQPDNAYFGEKDAHQVAIIRRMVKDLNFPVKIIGVATIRANDGLAQSSRNSLLTKDERKAARKIPWAIKEIAERIKLGFTDRAALTRGLIGMIESEPGLKVDYAALVDPVTLRTEDHGGETMIYAAVYVGDKRLTDNLIVKHGCATGG